MITLSCFWLLIVATFWRSPTLLKQKSQESWIVDLSGLIMQGVLIPLGQIWLLSGVYRWLLPHWEHQVKSPAIVGFLLSFVLIDYLYYWNHRWLHSRWGWPMHRVHHTMTRRDVLGTSRNTVWSSFFILYFWMHGLALFLLQDPTGYLLGVSVSNGLDLWRHSELDVPQNLQVWFEDWLIMPQDHALHHSCDRQYLNFGANLKFWDRLHGTVANHQYGHQDSPQLGLQLSLNLAQKLFWPFESVMNSNSSK